MSKTCQFKGHDWPTVGLGPDGRKIKSGTCQRCGRPHPNRNPEAFQRMKALAGMTPGEKTKLARKVHAIRQARARAKQQAQARELTPEEIERLIASSDGPAGAFERLRRALDQLFQALADSFKDLTDRLGIGGVFDESA